MRRPAEAGLDDHQIPASLLVRMQGAFAAHLICGIGPGVRIEALPARFAVKLPAFPEIHGGLVHHGLDPRRFGLRHTRRDQRSAAAHALDKNLGVFLADAGIGQRTKQAASHAADRHTAQQRSKPSGADDSADTGYSEHGDVRLAAVAAVAPIAAPMIAPSPLLSASLPVPSFRTGTTPAFFGALYQVSELFEMTLVSDAGRPAASSMRTTRLASLYES